MWQESYYLKLCTSPAKLITSESSSTDLSNEEAANGKLSENFWPVFGDMPEVVITKESFQIIDSIYSQMVAEIIVIIFYHVTFENVDVDYSLGKVSVDDGGVYSYNGTVAQSLRQVDVSLEMDLLNLVCAFWNRPYFMSCMELSFMISPLLPMQRCRHFVTCSQQL